MTEDNVLTGSVTVRQRSTLNCRELYDAITCDFNAITHYLSLSDKSHFIWLLSEFTNSDEGSPSNIKTCTRHRSFVALPVQTKLYKTVKAESQQ